MGANTISCPDCETLLQVSEAAATGRARIQCPRCGVQFSAAGPELEHMVSPSVITGDPHEQSLPRSMVPVLLASVAGAIVLVGGAVATIFFMSSTEPHSKPTTNQPVAQQPTVAAPTPKETAEEERRQKRFVRLMVRAGLAKEQKHFDEAIQAYQDALAVVPDDEEAADGLKQAQAGAAEARTADGQRHTDFQRYMQDATAALAGKQYARAVRAYESALQLVPGDPAAVGALADAKEKLARDTDEKKKLSDYEDHMTAGRADMVAQRYADAVREFLAAQRLLPDDAMAAQGVHDAEKRLDAVKNDEQRKAAYVQLMKQAGAAMQNRRYKEAVAAYKAAGKAEPNDPSARRGLRDAQKGLQEAKSEYTQLMNTGTAALQVNNVPAAIQAFQQAGQLFPGDLTAAAALQQARQLVVGAAAVQAAVGNAQLGYNELMVAGTAALFSQHYRDAAQAFTQALTIAPGDPQALQGLFQAQAGVVTRAQNRPSYAQKMRAGQLAYQRHQYGNAIASYQAALQLEPNNARALLGVAQASYAMHMTNGQADMTARRFRDAAREFQAALLQSPGDPLALNALRQATFLAR